MKTHHQTWKESVNEKWHFMNLSHNPHDDANYSARNSHKPVNFYCAAPNARQVALAGDFNHWHPLPMQRTVDGWWLAQVPLGHGHHQYRFLVDGEPMLDPHATGIGRDEQGERASLMAVS